MHVRALGQDVLPENRREIDWFPVRKPFNLFQLNIPPINDLKPSKKTFDHAIPLRSDMHGSVIMRADIFPIGVDIPAGPASLIASTPKYVARLTFLVTDDILSPSIIWPSSSELKL